MEASENERKSANLRQKSFATFLLLIFGVALVILIFGQCYSPNQKSSEKITADIHKQFIPRKQNKDERKEKFAYVRMKNERNKGLNEPIRIIEGIKLIIIVFMTIFLYKAFPLLQKSLLKAFSKEKSEKILKYNSQQTDGSLKTINPNTKSCDIRTEKNDKKNLTPEVIREEEIEIPVESQENFSINEAKPSEDEKKSVDQASSAIPCPGNGKGTENGNKDQPQLEDSESAQNTHKEKKKTESIKRDKIEKHISSSKRREETEIAEAAKDSSFFSGMKHFEDSKFVDSVSSVVLVQGSGKSKENEVKQQRQLDEDKENSQDKHKRLEKTETNKKDKTHKIFYLFLAFATLIVFLSILSELILCHKYGIDDVCILTTTNTIKAKMCHPNTVKFDVMEDIGHSPPEPESRHPKADGRVSSNFKTDKDPINEYFTDRFNYINLLSSENMFTKRMGMDVDEKKDLYKEKESSQDSNDEEEKIEMVKNEKGVLFSEKARMAEQKTEVEAQVDTSCSLNKPFENDPKFVRSSSCTCKCQITEKGTENEHDERTQLDEEDFSQDTYKEKEKTEKNYEEGPSSEKFIRKETEMVVEEQESCLISQGKSSEDDKKSVDPTFSVVPDQGRSKITDMYVDEQSLIDEEKERAQYKYHEKEKTDTDKNFDKLLYSDKETKEESKSVEAAEENLPINQAKPFENFMEYVDLAHRVVQDQGRSKITDIYVDEQSPIDEEKERAQDKYKEKVKTDTYKMDKTYHEVSSSDRETEEETKSVEAALESTSINQEHFEDYNKSVDPAYCVVQDQEREKCIKSEVDENMESVKKKDFSRYLNDGEEKTEVSNKDKIRKKVLSSKKVKSEKTKANMQAQDDSSSSDMEDTNLVDTANSVVPERTWGKIKENDVYQRKQLHEEKEIVQISHREKFKIEASEKDETNGEVSSFDEGQIYKKLKEPKETVPESGKQYVTYKMVTEEKGDENYRFFQQDFISTKQKTIRKEIDYVFLASSAIIVFVFTMTAVILSQKYKRDDTCLLATSIINEERTDHPNTAKFGVEEDIEHFLPTSENRRKKGDGDLSSKLKENNDTEEERLDFDVDARKELDEKKDSFPNSNNGDQKTERNDKDKIEKKVICFEDVSSQKTKTEVQAEDGISCSTDKIAEDVKKSVGTESIACQDQIIEKGTKNYLYAVTQSGGEENSFKEKRSEEIQTEVQEQEDASFISDKPTEDNGNSSSPSSSVFKKQSSANRKENEDEEQPQLDKKKENSQGKRKKRKKSKRNKKVKTHEKLSSCEMVITEDLETVEAAQKSICINQEKHLKIENKSVDPAFSVAQDQGREKSREANFDGKTELDKKKEINDEKKDSEDSNDGKEKTLSNNKVKTKKKVMCSKRVISKELRSGLQENHDTSCSRDKIKDDHFEHHSETENKEASQETVSNYKANHFEDDKKSFVSPVSVFPGQDIGKITENDVEEQKQLDKDETSVMNANEIKEKTIIQVQSEKEVQCSERERRKETEAAEAEQESPSIYQAKHFEDDKKSFNSPVRVSTGLDKGKITENDVEEQKQIDKDETSVKNAKEIEEKTIIQDQSEKEVLSSERERRKETEAAEAEQKSSSINQAKHFEDDKKSFNSPVRVSTGLDKGKITENDVEEQKQIDKDETSVKNAKEIEEKTIIQDKSEREVLSSERGRRKETEAAEAEQKSSNKAKIEKNYLSSEEGRSGNTKTEEQALDENICRQKQLDEDDSKSVDTASGAFTDQRDGKRTESDIDGRTKLDEKKESAQAVLEGTKKTEKRKYDETNMEYISSEEIRREIMETVEAEKDSSSFSQGGYAKENIEPVCRVRTSTEFDIDEKVELDNEKENSVNSIAGEGKIEVINNDKAVIKVLSPKEVRSGNTKTELQAQEEKSPFYDQSAEGYSKSASFVSSEFQDHNSKRRKEKDVNEKKNLDNEKDSAQNTPTEKLKKEISKVDKTIKEVLSSGKEQKGATKLNVFKETVPESDKKSVTDEKVYKENVNAKPRSFIEDFIPTKQKKIRKEIFYVFLASFAFIIFACFISVVIVSIKYEIDDFSLFAIPNINREKYSNIVKFGTGDDIECLKSDLKSKVSKEDDCFTSNLEVDYVQSDENLIEIYSNSNLLSSENICPVEYFTPQSLKEYSLDVNERDEIQLLDKISVSSLPNQVAGDFVKEQIFKSFADVTQMEIETVPHHDETLRNKGTGKGSILPLEETKKPILVPDLSETDEFQVKHVLNKVNGKQEIFDLNYLKAASNEIAFGIICASFMVSLFFFTLYKHMSLQRNLNSSNTPTNESPGFSSESNIEMQSGESSRDYVAAIKSRSKTGERLKVNEENIPRTMDIQLEQKFHKTSESNPEPGLCQEQDDRIVGKKGKGEFVEFYPGRKNELLDHFTETQTEGSPEKYQMKRESQNRKFKKDKSRKEVKRKEREERIDHSKSSVEVLSQRDEPHSQNNRRLNRRSELNAVASGSVVELPIPSTSSVNEEICNNRPLSFSQPQMRDAVILQQGDMRFQYISDRSSNYTIEFKAEKKRSARDKDRYLKYELKVEKKSVDN